MATNSLPLAPTFKHISVHMIHILARLQAKRLVQGQLLALNFNWHFGCSFRK